MVVTSSKDTIYDWKFLKRSDGTVGCVVVLLMPEALTENITFAVRTGRGTLDVERWDASEVEPLPLNEFILEAFISSKFNPKSLGYTLFFEDIMPLANYYDQNNTFGEGSGDRIFSDMEISRSNNYRREVVDAPPVDNVHDEFKYWSGGTYIDTYSGEVLESPRTVTTHKRVRSKIDLLIDYIKDSNNERNKICEA